RAERHQPRGRGEHHRAGRALRAGHHRDEHGLSRHRHPAPQQPGGPRPRRDGERVDPRLDQAGAGLGRRGATILPPTRASRAMREKYDEELQQLQERHGVLLADLEQRRSAALAKLTEADRKLRDLSPYRAVRSRYEEVSSVELIPAIRDHDPIPSRYARVKEEMEASLLEAGDGGAIASERSELEPVRVRYDETLRRWCDDGQRDEG